MELTFSPKVALCSPKNFNNDKFLADVNDSFFDLDFLTNEPPPPIPNDLMYEPPIFKIKKMASEIGNMLEKAKIEHSLKNEEVVSSFLKTDFDFSSNYNFKADDTEIRTVFDYIAKNRKNIHLASPLYPANDTLIVVSLMTPKSTNYELKRQVHQCFAVLGSNTIKQLSEKFVCPICKIAEVMAGPHCHPAQIELENKIIYDFDDGFDAPLGSILTKINCCGNYKSEGGCIHLITFNGAFAIHNDDLDHFISDIINNEDNNNINDNNNANNNTNNDNNTDDDISANKKAMIQSREKYDFNALRIQYTDCSFPIEINGKGANPPNCIKCKIRPGPIAVKIENRNKKETIVKRKKKYKNVNDNDDHNINYEEEEEEEEGFEDVVPFDFYCQKCFSEQVFDQEDPLVIDLSEHFFRPL